PYEPHAHKSWVLTTRNLWPEWWRWRCPCVIRMASCAPRWRATPQRPARRYEIYTTMFRTCDAPPTSLPISCSADLWVLTLATFVLGAVRMVTFVASAAG